MLKTLKTKQNNLNLKYYLEIILQYDLYDYNYIICNYLFTANYR